MSDLPKMCCRTRRWKSIARSQARSATHNDIAQLSGAAPRVIIVRSTEPGLFYIPLRNGTIIEAVEYADTDRGEGVLGTYEITTAELTGDARGNALANEAPPFEGSRAGRLSFPRSCYPSRLYRRVRQVGRRD